jgi:hypothetical protein
MTCQQTRCSSLASGAGEQAVTGQASCALAASRRIPDKSLVTMTERNGAVGNLPCFGRRLGSQIVVHRQNKK